jgi:N6-L-threonylcarbamoyladenine synthase
VDALAKNGDAAKRRFPKPYPTLSDLNFSFSGLKTALLYFLRDQEKNGQIYEIADVAAGYQRAIVEVLVDKTLAAAAQVGVRDIVVTGGVAANSELRSRFLALGSAAGCRVHIPPFVFCTDNAAMIAVAGLRLFREGRTSGLGSEPQPQWNLGEAGPG